MKSQKKKIISGILLVLSLFLIPYVSAVYYASDTTFYATDTNITVYTGIPLYIDEAIITNETISLTNVTYASSNLWVDWRNTAEWTLGDEDSIINLSSLPRYSSSTTTTIILTGTLNLASAKINITELPDGRTCENMNNFKFTSGSGATTTFTGMNARSVCESFITTGYNFDLASGTNTITLTYGTTTLATSIMKIIIGFLGLAALIFTVGMFMWFVKNNFDSFDPVEFAKYAILTLVVILLLIMLMGYIVDIL